MARMSSPHLKCCINVGFREAPCKKSFGILASYWTPPNITINASKVPFHANFMLLNDLQNPRQFPT